MSNENQQKALLRAYWRITGIWLDDLNKVPEQAKGYLSTLSYDALVLYDVQQDHRRGLSLRVMGRKYGLGTRIIRRMVKTVSDMTQK